MTHGGGQPAQLPTPRLRAALGVVALLAGCGAVTAADAPPPVRVIDARTSAGAAAAADLRAACDDASLYIAAGQARSAENRLVQALAAAGDNASASERERAGRLLAEARSVLAGAQTATDAAERSAAAAAARSATGAIGDAATSLRQERLARIADLRKHGHIELALDNCRRLRFDLPDDREVETLFDELLEAAHDRRNASLTEREADLREEMVAQVERSLLPEGLDGMPIFPSDWNDRRSGRDAVLDAPQRPPPWKENLLDRLAQRVSIVFEGTTAVDAIQALNRLSGVNLVVSPEIMASAERTITLRAAGMRLEHVLTWVTDQLGTTWSLTDGAIFIGPRPEEERIVAAIDASALLSGIQDFPGPILAFSSDAGGGGGGLLAAPAETPAKMSADDIVDLIKRSVSPSVWTQPNTAISIRGQYLLITAPEETHRLVREFLRAQTDQHTLSVRVDARWLEISDTYLEEIGVEWRSSPNRDLITSNIMTPTQNEGGFLRRLEGYSWDGAARNSLPPSVSSAQNNGGNGLTLQAALLGASQASAILTANEISNQGRSMQLPALTCLNGQRAHAFYGTQAAFISDYEIVGGTYDPVIKVLSLGVVLDIRPLVSADRRHVTLQLRTATAKATFFTDYIASVIVVANTIIDGTDPVGLPVTNDPNNPIEPTGLAGSYPIELPNVAINEIATTVDMPDRGSLLVGGFTYSYDQFGATRIPLLGSVPFLGRLFGARGRYQGSSKLCLLSTVTIINYPELEARL